MSPRSRPPRTAAAKLKLSLVTRQDDFWLRSPLPQKSPAIAGAPKQSGYLTGALVTGGPGVFFRDMPTEFLTDDEAAAYGRYAGTLSQEELDRMLARKPAQPGTSGVIESFCHFVRFFATSQAGERWTAGHPGTFLLTLADAHDLATRFNTRMSPRTLA